VSNQGLKQASIRAVTGTAWDYNGDWHALFNLYGVADGDTNGRMLAWINAALGTSYTELNGAQAAYAISQGARSWGELGTFTPDFASYSAALRALLVEASTTGLVLDFANNVAYRLGARTAATAVSGFTYTRSGSAYDLAGATLFGANTPRRTSAGLLVEAGATNLALWSQDFSNGVWSASNATVTTGVSDPSGGTGAQTITATAPAGTAYQVVGGSLGVGTTYTGSMWMRRRTGSGTISLVQPNGAGITDVVLTSAWQRMSVSGPGATAAGNNFVGPRIATSGDAIDVWSAQFEVGSSASSLIPTTTSSASRGADAASITGLSFSGAHSVIALVGTKTAVSGESLYNLSDGTSANRSTIYQSTSRTLTRVDSGGVNQGDTDSGAWLTTAQKIAARIQTNDARGAVDGALGTTDTGVTLPVGTLSTLGIGSRGGSNFPNGLIQLLAIVPRALTDGELTGATS